MDKSDEILEKQATGIQALLMYTITLLFISYFYFDTMEAIKEVKRQNEVLIELVTEMENK